MMAVIDDVIPDDQETRRVPLCDMARRRMHDFEKRRHKICKAAERKKMAAIANGTGKKGERK
jgi:hypothetical protein